MTTPVRVQLRRAKGWRMPENTVVVARPSRWGNPCRPSHYKVRSTATGVLVPRDMRVAQEMAVRGFEQWLEVCLPGQAVKVAAWTELRGKNLACWCRLCEAHKEGRPLGVECDECAPCHVDVLLELANR